MELYSKVITFFSCRPKKAEIRLPKGHIDPRGEASHCSSPRNNGRTGYADLEIVAELGSALVEFELEGAAYKRTEFYFLMELKSDRQIERPKHDSAHLILSGAQRLKAFTS